jgi:hypothetical protein
MRFFVMLSGGMGRTPEEWYEAKAGFFFMLSYGM